MVTVRCPAEGCELLAVSVEGVVFGAFGYALERADHFEYPRSDDVRLFCVVHGSRRTLWAAQSGRSRWATRARTSAGVGGAALWPWAWAVSGSQTRMRGCAAAAAEGGVELAAIHGGGDDDVGLVDREALRGRDGGRVRQVHWCVT